MERIKVAFYIKDVRNPTDKKNEGNELSLCFNDWRNMDLYNFDLFVQKLKDHMNICDSEIRVSYLDDDNDEVPIECNEELLEFLRIAYFYSEGNKEYLTVLIRSLDPEMMKSTPVDDEKVFVMRKRSLDKLKKSCKRGKTSAKQQQFAEDVAEKRRDPLSEVAARDNERQWFLSEEEFLKLPEDVVSFSKHRKFHDLRSLPKRIGEKIDKETEKVAKEQKEAEKVPGWFKDYMQEFKSEILSEVNEIVNDALQKDDAEDSQEIDADEMAVKMAKREVADEEAATGPLAAAAAAATSATAEFCQHPRNQKLLRKLEKLQKREKRLDQRMEKMETKKKKMWEKVSATRCARVQSPKTGSGIYLMGAIVLKDSGPHRVTSCSTFTKVWQFINNGSLPWTDKTELRLAWGSPGLEPNCSSLPCPLLEPNQIGTMSITFKVPSHLGSYESYWHFFHMGERFGPWVSCAVIVEQTPDYKPGSWAEQITEQIKRVTLKESALQQSYESDADSDGLAIVSDDTDEEKADDGFVVVPMPPCFFPNTPEGAVDPVPVKVKRRTSNVHDQKRNRPESKAKAVAKRDEEDYDDDEGAVGYVLPRTLKGQGVGQALHCCAENSTAKEPQKPDGSQSSSTAENRKDCAALEQIMRLHLFAGQPNYHQMAMPEFMNFGPMVDVNGALPFHGPPPPPPAAFIHPPYIAAPHLIAPPPPPAGPFTHIPPPVVQSQPLLPMTTAEYGLARAHALHYMEASEDPAANLQDPLLERPKYFSTQTIVPQQAKEGPADNKQEQIGERKQPDMYWARAVQPPQLHMYTGQWESPAYVAPPEPRPQPAAESEEVLWKDALKLDRHLLAENIDGQTKEKPASSKVKMSSTVKQSHGCVVKKQKAHIKSKKPKHQENDFDLPAEKFSKRGKTSSETGDERERFYDASGRVNAYDCQPIFERCTERFVSKYRASSDTKKGESAPGTKPAAGGVSYYDGLNKKREPDAGRKTNAAGVGRPHAEAAPVHILPETLVNGAIGMASAAYSTAINAFNSLRPRHDDLSVGDNEKFEQGMSLLIEMGFNNYAKNAELLRQYNFVVSEVVENYCLNL